VTYRNITIKDAACPILLRVTGKLRSGEPIKKVGAIRNVTISNVTVVDCKKGEEGFPRTCFISGQPDSPLENIKLENVTITYRGGGTEREAGSVVPESGHNSGHALGPLPASGFYIRHIKELTFKDVDVRFEKPDARPLFSVSDVNGLELDGLNSRNSPSAKTLRIEKIENFTVRRSPRLRDRSGENVASLLTE
jgi:hypothetical protein